MGVARIVALTESVLNLFDLPPIVVLLMNPSCWRCEAPTRTASLSVTIGAETEPETSHESSGPA
ncbi:hypothetical protein D3C81_2239160 [compost metagenome]